MPLKFIHEKKKNMALRGKKTFLNKRKSILEKPNVLTAAQHSMLWSLNWQYSLSLCLTTGNIQKSIKACSQNIHVYEAQTQHQLFIKLSWSREKESLGKVKRDGEAKEGQETQRGSINHNDCAASRLQTAGICQASEKSSPYILGIK